MSTTVIRAESAADFLALVPALAGFRITESLAIVPMVNRRSVGVARFDLHEGLLNSPESIVEALVNAAPGVTSVALVVYTEAKRNLGVDVAHAVMAAFMVHPVQVADVLLVGEGTYVSLFDGIGIPHDVAEIEASPNWPRSVEVLGKSPTDKAALPTPSDEFRDEVHELVPRIGWSLMPIDPADRSAENVARAIVEIRRSPKGRDALLVSLAGGKDEGIFLGVADVDPDPKRLADAHQFTKLVAAIEPTADTLVVAAWFCWSLGYGSAAGALVDRALEHDSQHYLSNLFTQFIGAGVLPEWAQAKGQH